MRVSIITPTFNSEKYIRSALESIKSQTYPDIEHVVMDNLSTDNTREICSNYSNKFISQKDSSMYEALNNGIARSTGDILAFLNSDDLYPESDTIRKVVDCFGRNKDVDVVYGNCEMVDENLNYLYLHKPKVLNFKFAIKRVFVVIHQAIFVRADIFKKYGLYDLNLRYMADCEYWIRLLRENVKFKYYDEKLAVFRRHANNMSVNTKDGLKETKYIMSKYGYKHNGVRQAAYLLKDYMNNPDYLAYSAKRRLCKMCDFLKKRI